MSAGAGWWRRADDPRRPIPGAQRRRLRRRHRQRTQADRLSRSRQGRFDRRGREADHVRWYDTEHDDLLNELGCLRAGSVVRGLSPSQIPGDVKQGLFHLAHGIWPGPWRDAVLAYLAADEVFATPIAECMPERLVRGRVALVGDAAHVAGPMTGSGLAHGLLDADSLALALGSHPDPHRALRAFEGDRLVPSRALVSLSRARSRRYLGMTPGYQAG